jgi:hypothetical protein
MGVAASQELERGLEIFGDACLVPPRFQNSMPKQKVEKPGCSIEFEVSLQV